VGEIFGTDGARGVANVDLTPELVMDLGQALVTVLHEGGDTRPSILVGRDPRWSGEMLESALVAGITAAGGDAVVVGVLPTPGVAHLTARSSAAAGAIISASHNPVTTASSSSGRRATSSAMTRRSASSASSTSAPTDVPPGCGSGGG